MAIGKPEKRHYGVREVLIAVVIMVLVILAILNYSGGGLLREGTKMDFGSAPEIEFELPSGKATSIIKLKGTTLLLNFWASWCAPCIEEMPSLRILEEHLKDKGFVVLAFNISETREQVRGRLTGAEMPENLIFNFNKDYLRPYDINAIPVSVLIDSTGIIRQTYSGPRNWLDMRVRMEIENVLR